MTTRTKHQKVIAAALDLERRNFLILLVAGALALAAAMGLADMAGYNRLVDAVQDVVPTWFAVCFGGQVVAYLGYVLAVRDIARVDGGPLLSFRLSMRTVVAGFGVFAATHAAGGFSVDYWTFRRSGLRRPEAVARVLALGALEYAVLAPAAMICAVVLLFGTGGHVQHAMTYPWLAVVPGFLARAVGQLAEACRAALRPGARRAPAPVVRASRRRDRQAPLPADGAAPARARRDRSQPLLARRHRLPVGGAEDLQRRDLDACADPRLRDGLRRHAALAAGRGRRAGRGDDDLRPRLGGRAARAGAARRRHLPGVQLLAAGDPGARGAARRCVACGRTSAAARRPSRTAEQPPKVLRTLGGMDRGATARA